MSDDLDALRPVVVVMPEAIDAGNASAVGSTLDAAFAKGAMVVVADCTPTTFCDSVGFNTLLLTNHKAHAAETELLFVITPNGPLRRVLELLEMQDALEVYPTIEAAVTASLQLRSWSVIAPRSRSEVAVCDTAVVEPHWYQPRLRPGTWILSEATAYQRS